MDSDWAFALGPIAHGHHFCHKWLLRVILAILWLLHLHTEHNCLRSTGDLENSGKLGVWCTGWVRLFRTGKHRQKLFPPGVIWLLWLHSVHTSPILSSVPPAHPSWTLCTLVQRSRCSFKQLTSVLRFVCFVDNCYTVIELCVYSAACFVWITQSFPRNVTTP